MTSGTGLPYQEAGSYSECARVRRERTTPTGTGGYRSETAAGELVQ